jgi:cytochrome c oxidase accessory protein FixG
MSKMDLHDSRLGTTDELGHRIFLHPEEVKGKWRTYRTQVYALLVLIYIITPWLHWDGVQLFLINIPNREFTILGEVFYAHEIPYMIFIFLGLGFLIAFITSIFGRLWCGWACPQTVFIDLIFRRIDLIVEGNARKRKKLDEAVWGLEKVFKRSTKWLLYIFAGLVLSHSFLGYFMPTKELFDVLTHSPASNWTAFVITWSITALIVFDFGWFREQFCIIACPYGRMQSVLMDKDSFVVAYDYNRGEPRKAKEVTKDQQGDCVNCFACVKACPTGIDIRRGTQLECIACTQCIDACDDIMLKVNKPEGLIRYTTESELTGEKTNFFKPRSFVYLAAFLIVMSVGLFLISSHGDLRVAIFRGSNTAFNLVKKGDSTQVINHYKFEFNYQGKEKFNIVFKVSEADLEVVTPQVPFLISNKRKNTANVFFKFKPDFLIKGTRQVEVQMVSFETQQILLTKEVILVGPIN